MKQNLTVKTSCALFIMLALFYAPAAAAAGRNDAGAENFIRDFTGKISLIVSNKNRPLANRSDDIRALLLANIDVRRIGLFMLGRYARKIKRSELPQYIELLKNYGMRVFVNRLLVTKNAHTVKIKIIKSTQKGTKGKEAIVLSQLTVEGLEQPIQVRWWIVRDKNNVIKIFNIGVEGFWIAQEQRAIFTSLIQKNNGNPKVVLKYLRQRLKEAKQNPSRENSQN